MGEIEEVAEHLAVLVAGGMSTEQACHKLARYEHRDVLERARVHYETRVGIITKAKEPCEVVSPNGLTGWYPGPTEQSVRWHEFRKNVVGGLPPEAADEAVHGIDHVTSRILNHVGKPGATVIRTKGLVIGYVQSGKTTNFMGLMAKAADTGYRLLIVLSGVTENLRSQTQSRIEGVMLGQHPERWFKLTDASLDFTMSGNAANLLADPNQRMIAVVKKNGSRLRRLNNWIKSAGKEIARTVPILIIDDESDQASLNVAAGGRTSRINGLIGQILANDRSAYVAYSATPFANLLTDPLQFSDLYPKDFIVEMPQPAGYFGAERLFGRAALGLEEADDVSPQLDMIREVDQVQADLAKPPPGKGAVFGWDPTITASLEASLDWFILASAARLVREGKRSHSTMLLHTSMLAEAHNRLRDTVKNDYLHGVAAGVESDPKVRGRLQRLWEAETGRVPSESVGLVAPSWADVAQALPEILRECRVIVDNYTSTERLVYKKESPQTAVVIGGNTLSRGLTLEGLVSSYFVRSASAYDTLLQMGRWFGYRRGYEDLPRVWMTNEMTEWFCDLATVEEEIRREIRTFGPEVTPEMVGVKIREHPAMTITSAAKMRSAIPASISYGGRREQTILFEHSDAQWLQGNTAATRALVSAECTATRDDLARGRYLVEGVSHQTILEFLDHYSFHPRSTRLRRDLLKSYILREFAEGALETWNIVVVENPSMAAVADLDLGLGRPVRPVFRSRVVGSEGYANIGVLGQPLDRVEDLLVMGTGLAEVAGMNDRELAKYRQDVVGDVGLMCVYPIHKDSEPTVPKSGSGKPTKKERTKLAAAGHVIGIEFIFPESRAREPIAYMVAPVSVAIEDVEEELAAIDAADEVAADQEEATNVGGGSDS